MNTTLNEQNMAYAVQLATIQNFGEEEAGKRDTGLSDQSGRSA